MKTGRIRVRHHSPLHHYGIRIIGVVAIVFSGFGLYYAGQKTAGYDATEADDTIDGLQDQIAQLKGDKVDLRDQLALIERSSQVDTQAYVQVKDNLKALQQEILELREEVGFYRGIVAPRESSAGLRIDRLEITKASGKRLFHYNLVLTQVLKNHRNVRGRFKLIVEGVQNDRPKKLKMRNVSVAKNNSLDFKFKYFQKFEGDLVLPEGFSPRQITVEVSPHKRKKLLSAFDWPIKESADVIPTPVQTGSVSEESGSL